MCSDDTALAISEKLEVLKQYPREEKARAVIADMIQEICPTDRDADRLFREVREAYNTWPGPQEFSTFARGKMRAAAQRPELQEWKPEGWKYVPECGRCGDDGYIRLSGSFQPCQDCGAGKKIDQRFLKLLNDTAAAGRDLSGKPNRTDAPMKPTATEIAKIMRQKRERAKR